MAKSYSTADLSLSAYLISRGHPLRAVRREGGRGVFAFTDCEDLQADLLSWANNQPVSLAVRAFVNSMRDLKGLVAAS